MLDRILDRMFVIVDRSLENMLVIWDRNPDRMFARCWIGCWICFL